jgi:hypothetical protein
MPVSAASFRTLAARSLTRDTVRISAMPPSRNSATPQES